jgi:hypothetical protein
MPLYPAVAAGSTIASRNSIIRGPMGKSNECHQGRYGPTVLLRLPRRLGLANSQFLSISWISLVCYDCAMCNLAALVLHVLATIARLAGPGGARAVVAESCGAGRESAGIDPRRGWRPRESPLVSLATALSWALSHADGGLRCVRDACGRHV